VDQQGKRDSTTTTTTTTATTTTTITTTAAAIARRVAIGGTGRIASTRAAADWVELELEKQLARVRLVDVELRVG
jgi:hypothetical protein